MTTAFGTGLAVIALAQATATGSRHERRGLGNEDAVGCAPLPSGFVAAVADGHSDPRCIRAREGAELAVDAAVAAGGEATADGFLRALVTGWRRRVDDDLLRRPGPGVGRLAYGTTLLACRVDAAGLILFQLGDGAVVVVDGTGARRLAPTPPPQGAPAGATRSMAEDRAEHVARAVDVPAAHAPRLVLLATDGLDNAYDRSTGLIEVARDLAEREELRDAGRLDAEVAAWVRRAAETSGDDATAAVLLLGEEPR